MNKTETIMNILAKYDPAALIQITHKPNEYRSEAARISEQLDCCQNVEDIIQLLERVFLQSLSPEPASAQRSSRLRQAAEDIFQTLFQ